MASLISFLSICESGDYFASLEVRTLRRTQAEQFAEHIVLVLAQRRRQPPNANVVRARKPAGRPYSQARRNIRGAHFDKRLAFAQMRVVSDVLQAPGHMGAHA